MNSLPIFVVARDRPVMLIGEGEAAAAKRRLLERAGVRIVGEEAEAALAIVATERPEATAARLRGRGILLNVVDRPDLSDFFLPAILDRDPVIVAIGTGGASAGLAAALRQRLEQLLPEGLGRLAERLRSMRGELAERFPDPAARRRKIAAMLASGEDEPDPDDDGAPRLETISIRSPDPDELTLRAARLLGLADRIYHPADMPPALLDRARADAVRIVGPAPALLEPGLSVELCWVPE